MKKSGKYFWLAVLVLIEGCRDKDEIIPILPTITSAHIDFDESNGDAVLLTVEFSDGEFDVGLAVNETAPPYHHKFFFAVLPGSYRTPIYSTLGKIDGWSDEVFLLQFGESVPGYLEPYSIAKSTPALANYSCGNYTTTAETVAVTIKDSERLGFVINSIIDTIPHGESEALILKDSFLVQSNPFHHNLRPDFLVEETSGDFEVFNWKTVTCGEGFYARIPPINNTAGATQESGPFKIWSLDDNKVRLVYRMASPAFRTIMGGKTIMLRIQILDRTTNESNIYETNSIRVPN